MATRPPTSSFNKAPLLLSPTKKTQSNAHQSTKQISWKNQKSPTSVQQLNMTPPHSQHQGRSWRGEDTSTTVTLKASNRTRRLPPKANDTRKGSRKRLVQQGNVKWVEFDADAMSGEGTIDWESFELNPSIDYISLLLSTYEGKNSSSSFAESSWGNEPLKKLNASQRTMFSAKTDDSVVPSLASSNTSTSYKTFPTQARERIRQSVLRFLDNNRKLEEDEMVGETQLDDLQTKQRMKSLDKRSSIMQEEEFDDVFGNISGSARFDDISGFNDVSESSFGKNDGVSTSGSSSNRDFLNTEEFDVLSSSDDMVVMHSRAKEHIKKREYQQAINIYLTLLQDNITIHGKKHLSICTLLHNLTILSVYNEQYELALKYATESVKVRKTLLGPSHIQVASSLLEVGIIFYALENFSNSLASLRESLQITCKAVGYDHSSVARILNNIACVHFEKRKYASAHATFDESLEIQRSSMGNVNSKARLALCNVATTLCNVAVVHYERGEVNECVEMMEEALMVQESVLGDDHPSVWCTKENLKEMSEKPTKRRKSMDLLLLDSSSVSSQPRQQTNSTPIPGSTQLKINPKAMFGEYDGIPKRNSRQNLRNLNYVDTTRIFDGIDVISLGPLKREFTTQQRIRVTINTWFQTPTSLNDENGGFTIEAVPHTGEHRKRISIPFDVDEQQVMDAELHLKGIYDQAVEFLEHGEMDEALELFHCSLRSHEEKYGRNHHLVGTALHNIGILHLYAENYEKASPMFQEAVKVRTTALGADHPDVSVSLIKTGIVQFALHQFDCALSTFCYALSLRRKTLGYSHPQVAKILNNIGCVHYEYGGLLAGLKAFEEALEIQRETLRGKSLSIASTLCNIGFIYVKRKEYGDAIVSLEEGLQILRGALGKESRDNRVEVTLANLAYAMAFANSKCEEVDEGIIQMIEMYTDMLRC